MIGNKKPNKESGSSSMEIHKRNLSGGKISRNNLEKEMKKTPIKMTFMKTVSLFIHVKSFNIKF